MLVQVDKTFCCPDQKATQGQKAQSEPRVGFTPSVMGGQGVSLWCDGTPSLFPAAPTLSQSSLLGQPPDWRLQQQDDFTLSSREDLRAC